MELPNNIFKTSAFYMEFNISFSTNFYNVSWNMFKAESKTYIFVTIWAEELELEAS